MCGKCQTMETEKSVANNSSDTHTVIARNESKSESNSSDLAIANESCDIDDTFVKVVDAIDVCDNDGRDANDDGQLVGVAEVDAETSANVQKDESGNDEEPSEKDQDCACEPDELEKSAKEENGESLRRNVHLININ